MSISLIQEFECIAYEVTPDGVGTSMADLTDRTALDEYAVIEWSAFDEADRAQVVEGTAFYWQFDAQFNQRIVLQKNLSASDRERLATMRREVKR